MIYDCFSFCNELMLLEIRLRELSPVVDKFVLVESMHAYSGKLKRLYYDEIKNNEIFAPFKDKIIHIIFKMKSETDRWANDHAQKDAIINGLSDAKPDDIIIVSDVDEVVDRRIIPVIKTLEAGKLQMKLFYYYFNCFKSDNWDFPGFCRFKDFQNATHLRHQSLPIIPNAGWHFSYLMPAGEIAGKLEAFAHSEYDTDYYKDTNRIQECMDTGKDLFGRGSDCTIIPLDAPEYVMNNQDKYKEFIK